MNPNERYQRNRARYHALVRQHDMTGPNIGLFLNDLQQLVDEIGREDLTDAESAVPPSVAALRRAGWWVDRSIWSDTERRAQANKVAPKQLEDGARAWVLKGYRKGNVADLIDFVVNGKADSVRADVKPETRRLLTGDPSQL